MSTSTVCASSSLPGNFEVPTLCIEKTIISGPTQVFIKTKEYWDLEIMVNYTDTASLTNVVVTDKIPSKIEVVSFTNSTGTVEITPGGSKGAGSSHLTWNIGTLDSGDSETLVLRIATGTNPAGKQRFSTAGIYDLNQGATVKGYHSGLDATITAGPTDPLTVEAINGS